MEFSGAEPKEVKIGDKIEIPTQKKLYDVTFPIYKAPSTYTVYAREQGYNVERDTRFLPDNRLHCMQKKVNILGTEYAVEVKAYTDDETFERSGIDGYCDSWLKKIVVCDMTTMPNFENEPKETCEIAQKETLRHEIVHAFFDESGLGDSSIRYADRGWAKNEEMVDWWALQGAKVYKAWESVGAV